MRKGGSGWRQLSVFVSWSGERSRAVAEALRAWLPTLVSGVKPWVSSNDIEAGARWADDLALQLKGAKCGIVCLTPENVQSPWIHFEAGAISRYLDTSLVCTYLLGMREADLAGPMVQFQASKTDREGTLAIARTLNRARPSGVSENELEADFDKLWPELESQIKGVSEDAPTSVRPMQEMIEELLDLARFQTRQQVRDRVSFDVPASQAELLRRVLSFAQQTSQSPAQLIEGMQELCLSEHGGEEEVSSLGLELANTIGTKWAAEEVRRQALPYALRELEDQVSEDPRAPDVHFNLARQYHRESEPEKALDMYNKAICLAPNVPHFLASRASLLATCKDAEFRDGSSAVKDAEQALALAEQAGQLQDEIRHRQYLQILAAAHAEAGNFELAKSWQTKALDLANTGRSRTVARGRLDLYNSGTPLRGPDPLRILLAAHR